MFNFGSKVSFASTTLSFPIFAADFDPYNRGYLVVGGGGGESKTGVPNQLAVLDVSNRATITPVVEIDLSRDEDSVQSVGSLATKDGLITLAGINSSQSAQNDNKNEHFRAFDIKLPPRKRLKTGEIGSEEKGSGSFIGKRSLFKPIKAIKKEAYQRILRLSPATRQETGSKRIGAIASGMSNPAEVVIFNATTAVPNDQDILARIETSAKDEVVDLDIAIADTDRFSVTWCTEYEILEQTFEYDFKTRKVQKTPKGPRRIHQMEEPDGTSKHPRSKFRGVRFLDAENILALVNRGGKQGAELRIIHLYPTGPATTILQMRLPSHIRQAVSMDVCLLDSDGKENRQIIVAVAGQDISIETYTLNRRGASGTFSKFGPFQTFKDVHQHQMTKVCFSSFHAPAAEKLTTSSPQYVRLASVSYGNSVVVDTFTLSQINSADPKSRHILTHPNSHQQMQWIYVALISLMVVVAAVAGQGYLSSIDDFSLGSLLPQLQPSIVPSKDAVQEMRESAASIVQEVVSTQIPSAAEIKDSAASVVQETVPSDIPGVQKLQEILHTHDDETKAVVVSDHNEELSFAVHDDKETALEQDADAKHWHELDETQRSYWKQRLIKAGRWAESEGESVFKGVLWSQYAAVVGEVAGEVLREL